MAKGFFENFPTMVYDNDGKGQYKEVVDIFRRVSLRNNLKNYIQLPLLQNIDGTQKPERLANLVHGDPKRNWLVMMMNDIENPYTDWFMGEEEFYKYMIEKYPNKYVQLTDNHYEQNTGSNHIYTPGEELSIHSGGEATLVKFDASLKSIVYTGDDISTGTQIVGKTSDAIGNAKKDSTSEFNAPHHIDVDGVVVENWDYEFNLNEAKSQVSVLNNDYIDRIEDEFKKRIT